MQGDGPIERLYSQSLNDTLYAESKSLAGGGVPFPGQGGQGGIVPVYSSWDSWDAAMDIRYGETTGQQTSLSYANKVGDLATNSLLCSAIRWLGNVLPKPPLYVKESTGKKGESKGVDNHPLQLLWQKPNKYYSGSTLKKGIAFSWVLKSEAFILKFFNNAGTEPVELWWEPHWTIRPVWPIDGSEFIAYYEVNRNGRWIPIPVENVIHLRDAINPYNQRQGFSTVPSILRELYADGEAANYYATLLGGSAVPPFLVGLDTNMRMDQKEIDLFTADIIRKTTGRRRGQPIVAKGAKAYKLGFNPRELDLRESRYAAEERFCAVMGIPAVCMELGSGMEHSIYNNVEQAEARAWQSYVLPLLSHIEEELNVQLLPDWEGEVTRMYCQHDLSKIQALQEDEDNKAERITLLYDSEIIMRNEARSAMNYGPSDPNNEDADKVFKSQTKPQNPLLPEALNSNGTTAIARTRAPLSVVRALHRGESPDPEEIKQAVKFFQKLQTEEQAKNL